MTSPANPGGAALLILNLYMVYPPDSGAKVVIFNRLVELSRRFRLTFCCLGEHPSDEDGARALAPYAEVVIARGAWSRRGAAARLASSLRDPCAQPFAAKLEAWFASAEMRVLLAERRFDLIELHSSCWYRHRLDDAPGLKVLVAHNRERDYYAARARAAWRLDGPVAGLRAALDCALVAAQERRAVRASDAVVSLAPLSASEKAGWFGARPVLCNWGGVDLSAYASESPAPAGRGGPRLVFVAALFVESAVEAAARFVRDALPAILTAYPEARFSLVGDSRGNATIERLGVEHPQVELCGRVPDVRPHIAAADVVVVPILSGSGVRYKIMEACAAGKAVVSTRKGAEGLGLQHGRDALLADSVAAMAPLVVEVLGDAALRRRLERGARETAEQRFDRAREHRHLADWYEDLLDRRLTPGPGSASPRPRRRDSSPDLPG